MQWMNLVLLNTSCLAAIIASIEQTELINMGVKEWLGKYKQKKSLLIKPSSLVLPTQEQIQKFS